MSARILHLTAGLLVLSLLASCGQRTRLHRIEALLQDRPDSALTLLRAIDTAGLHSSQNRARYHLLTAMASDRNQLDKSIYLAEAEQAADWFDRHPSRRFRHVIYFYRGELSMESGQYDQAYTSLSRASEEAIRKEDWYYAGMANLRLASLYHWSGRAEQAYEYAARAQNFFTLTHDTRHFFATGDGKHCVLPMPEILYRDELIALDPGSEPILDAFDEEGNPLLVIFTLK